MLVYNKRLSLNIVGIVTGNRKDSFTYYSSKVMNTLHQSNQIAYSVKPYLSKGYIAQKSDYIFINKNLINII